ncbi:hypothetical protein NP493_752g01077 [Ridgeia piscesae]|uniref:Uncharacterized protein n=1 Tax=Ridgeia piscesae TaxID=27915 RepID=A0AAD9KPF2_RIDPI|nr:hypothetical protein NP493_752g01077 [Ridgeia piscesae]
MFRTTPAHSPSRGGPASRRVTLCPDHTYTLFKTHSVVKPPTGSTTWCRQNAGCSRDPPVQPRDARACRSEDLSSAQRETRSLAVLPSDTRVKSVIVARILCTNRPETVLGAAVTGSQCAGLQSPVWRRHAWLSSGRGLPYRSRVRVDEHGPAVDTIHPLRAPRCAIAGFLRPSRALLRHCLCLDTSGHRTLLTRLIGLSSSHDSLARVTRCLDERQLTTFEGEYRKVRSHDLRSSRFQMESDCYLNTRTRFGNVVAGRGIVRPPQTGGHHVIVPVSRQYLEVIACGGVRNAICSVINAPLPSAGGVPGV